MKKLFFKDNCLKLALLLLSIILSLFLCEILVRYFEIAPDIGHVEIGRFQLSSNTRIGIEPIPFSPGEKKAPSNRGHVGIPEDFNSLGFRDSEPSDKKDGVRRIIFLGDSLTMGSFMKDIKQIFPYKVSKYLEDNDINAQVLNFGVSGYNTVQEVETLKTKGLDLNPDIVVLQYCLNDKGVVDSGRLKNMIQTLSSSTTYKSEWILKHFGKSALVRFLYGFFSIPEIDSTSAYSEIFNPDTAKAFSELKVLSDKYGFKVLVFIFPTRNMGTKGHDKMHRKVRKEISDAGLEYYDLLDVYRKCEKDSNNNLWRDLYHPNANGHTCAAKYIYKKVSSLILNSYD